VISATEEDERGAEGRVGMAEKRRRRMLQCPPVGFHKEPAVLAGWRFRAGKYRDEKEQIMVV
jgi:hypothetical protein